MAKKFNTYTYNGVTFRATGKTSSDRSDKKYMRWVRYDGDERLVHWGDPGMEVKADNPEDRAKFNSRHDCKSKRDPKTPGFMACWDWNSTREGRCLEMPYANVPSSKTAAMDSCVKQVMSERGYEKPRAIAICYSSVVEGVAIDQAISESEAAIQAARANESRHSIEATIERKGTTWEVTIMGPSEDSPLITHQGREYILSANGRAYDLDALRRNPEAWDGIKVYDNHLTDKEFNERGGMRSFIGEGVGILKDPHFDEGAKALKARLEVVDDKARQKFVNAHERGVLQHIGLSVDVMTDEGRDISYEGRKIPTMIAFDRIFSVDVVSDPAAGGGFNRLIAAKQMEVRKMEIQREELEQLIDERIAAAAANVQEQEAETPEEAAQMVADVVEDAAEEAAAMAETPEEAATMVADAAQEIADEVAAPEEMKTGDEPEEMESRVEALECRLKLRDELARAKLTPELTAMVREALDGKTFTDEELEKMIKRAKEAQRAGDRSGKPKGAGGAAVGRVTWDERDKRELDLMRLLMGEREMRNLENNDAYYVRERTPEAYRKWVKEGHPKMGTGHRRISEWLFDIYGGNPLTQEARFTEAISSITTITKNTVNIMLANDYSKREEWWTDISEEHEVDTIDDATLARVFGMSTLSQVEKAAAYTDLQFQDEEETASFQKYGNTVSIAIEDLMKDKINAIRTIPQRLSNAWYNTLSKLVAAVFTTNSATGPVLADTGALFNATATSSTGGHANLLTAALSYDNFSAARTAMMKQTDQPSGAGSKLLIKPRYLLVPVDLESAGLQIRNSEFIPSSQNNDINPYNQQFDVVIVPEWTDANDWALVGDPTMYPAIHLIFPTGMRVPQLFTADNPTAGAMFTNDVIKYKVQLMTYTFSSTYECAPVSDFRPLHKNNVT
jgi:hypothetical protein